MLLLFHGAKLLLFFHIMLIQITLCYITFTDGMELRGVTERFYDKKSTTCTMKYPQLAQQIYHNLHNKIS